MPHANQGLTAAQVADEFSRTAKVLVRHFNERLGEHGVSTPRSRLVVEVARSQPRVHALGTFATPPSPQEISPKGQLRPAEVHRSRRAEFDAVFNTMRRTAR